MEDINVPGTYAVTLDGIADDRMARVSRSLLTHVMEADRDPITGVWTVELDGSTWSYAYGPTFLTVLRDKYGATVTQIA